jgi:hypothetical protein
MIISRKNIILFVERILFSRIVCFARKIIFYFVGNGEKEIDSLELFVLQEKYYFIFWEMERKK